MGTNTSLSARISRNNVLRYGLAIASALVASLLCSGVQRFLGEPGCYVILLLAVTFSAWYCGVGPTIPAVMLALIGTTFGFIPKVPHFAYINSGQWLDILVFLTASVVVVLMGEKRRQENRRLLQAQDELELRVQERTADLDAVNRNLRELSARLMQLQDEERRRIARELHDSVGQTLAALGMNLSLVRNDVERLAGIVSALNDSENLVREMSSEVRTISHLLHPPLLDEAGLCSALRWYVDGFAQRSGIKVDLDVPDDFGRLPGELETAIFRVVQESLTNIHRHSGSSAAHIELRQRGEQVVVEIADRGRGIPPEKLQEMASSGTPGVGIRGMRERLRQLGGTLEIESSKSGTVVMVTLPVEHKSATQGMSLVDPAAA
ncbi:MAG TPA: sensor histidine kinase [Candidatus Sulfotelmatobacter sp.]|nr:sensor histidine kinase [Candidatus Sulfotelmatobacter sp.]